MSVRSQPPSPQAGRIPSATRGRPAAVLFDMDGTLVDTEPYWIAAEYALVAEYGGTWTDEHAHNLVGSALELTGAYIRKHGPVPLEPEQIVTRLLVDVIEQVRAEIPWRPGARQLLAECVQAGVPTALVTMSYLNLAQAVVDRLPAGTFATVVSGDQVSLGKPHPEAYLTACARLGVDPSSAVAVEDSPTGVSSAMAAGCVTVAVPHHVPIPPRDGLTIVASLAGVGLAQLGDLVTARPPAGPADR